MSDVRERMQEIAHTVEVLLPPGTGFIVLAFDLERSEGRLEYVANAERDGVVLAMREFIVRTENQWAEHLTEPADRKRCPTCGQKFGANP